jgi:peptidoglycan/xylan/chitin deacetylase (PgdA/CDA1 family)
VSPANFAEHLEVLRDTGRVAPFEHAGPGEIAVTFDDGYADNLVLREAGLPVTVFVTTRYVDERRAFWWDAVDRANVPEIVRLDDRAFLGSDRYPIKRYLQPMRLEDIDAHLRTLGDDGSVPPDDRPMTPEELRELAAADHVTIGAHTRTHRSLRHAPVEDQHDEIAGSRDDVERLIGVRPTTFAYPYGVPGGDFDEVAVAAVRAAGFTAAAANAPMPSADRLTIPRHAVADVGGEEFARWLDGLR